MSGKIHYIVNAKYDDPKCLSCGEVVSVPDGSSIAECDCGAVVLNPKFEANRSSLHVSPQCHYCDDTGLIWLPLTGARLYIVSARCVCPKGDLVSDKITRIPRQWIDRQEHKFGIHAASFLGQRRRIHDASERKESNE